MFGVLAVSCAFREMIKANHNLHLSKLAANSKWTSQNKYKKYIKLFRFFLLWRELSRTWRRRCRMKPFLINFQNWSIMKRAQTRIAWLNDQQVTGQPASLGTVVHRHLIGPMSKPSDPTGFNSATSFRVSLFPFLLLSPVHLHETYIRLSERESRANKILWRKNFVRIRSEKYKAATSLRNQFYSIFWCVVSCFSCVNLNEGFGWMEEKMLFMSLARFALSVTRPFEFVISCWLLVFSFLFLPLTIHCNRCRV